jgi:peptide/nickel transport system permease protein
MKQNNEIAKKPSRKQRSAKAEIWRNFKRNRGAIIGLAILGTIVFLAIASEFIFDYDTQVVRQRVSERLQGPSLKYPLGTDQYGRDIMTRIIYGARFSLSVGIVAVMVSLVVGATLGLVAGFYGGVIENLIMRVSDVFGSIPSILLAITISAAFGQSMFVLMVSVGIVSVPAFARVARAAAMTVRDQEYIEAARAAGARDWQIIAYHVIPNSMAPILVQCTMRVASAIIAASSLSFLGLGVPLPAPEWGAMLSEGRGFIRNYSYMTLFPGLAIMITVLAINLIGDGLRDAMDPKLKRR